MIDLAKRAVLAFALGWFLMTTFQHAFGAELPIPKPREPCVAPDVKPSAGQTIHADKTCPNGMRWRREK